MALRSLTNTPAWVVIGTGVMILSPEVTAIAGFGFGEAAHPCNISPTTELRADMLRKLMEVPLWHIRQLT